MPKFNTIATELLEHAETAYKHFRISGYTVKVEPIESSYPSCPAMVCKMGHTQMAIIVCGRIVMSDLEEWISLAKSLSYDFQIAVCISEESQLKFLPKHQLKIKELGIGVFVSKDEKIFQIVTPVDQNIRLQLPDLTSLPANVRKILGPSYKHFLEGQWRLCFDAACKAFEQKVRPYFKKSIASKRLSVFDKNGHLKNPSTVQINKMTLGQLGEAFGRARPLNGADSKIHKTITQINPDRVNVAHKNNQVNTENRLRKNVGLHMHSIIQATRELT